MIVVNEKLDSRHQKNTLMWRVFFGLHINVFYAGVFHAGLSTQITGKFLFRQL
jgi:hypothetical protein